MNKDISDEDMAQISFGEKFVLKLLMIFGVIVLVLWLPIIFIVYVGSLVGRFLEWVK